MSYLFDYQELTCIKRKCQNGLSEANYFYKNSSIYFNENLNFDNMLQYAIHEAIHYLQEVKDKKNYLVRLGICEFTEFKIYGMGLNEAAVQYMASKAINSQKDTIKYYGITFSTISPSCYSIECNLLEQILYLCDENIMVDSTLNSNDQIKYELIDLCGESIFYKIQKNFDTLLYSEENLIKLNNKLQYEEENEKTIIKLIKKIDLTRQKIIDTYFETQDLILSSYFDKAFKKIKNLEQLENYRRKLYNYKNLIGINDTYAFYNEYYIEQMTKLEEKHNQLENTKTDLIPVPSNRIFAFFQSIKNFIFGKDSQYTTTKDK